MDSREGVVAFACRAPRDARANALVADIASFKATSRHIPVYTQFAINMWPNAGRLVTYIENVGLNKFPTPEEFVAGAIRWALQNEISKAWIITSPAHVEDFAQDLAEASAEARMKTRFMISPEVRETRDWGCSCQTISFEPIVPVMAEPVKNRVKLVRLYKPLYQFQRLAGLIF